MSSINKRRKTRNIIYKIIKELKKVKKFLINKTKQIKQTYVQSYITTLIKINIYVGFYIKTLLLSKTKIRVKNIGK